LFIKRLALFVCLAVCQAVLVSNVQASNVPKYDEQTAKENHESHSGHSDHLLILLRHKIALQKLQQVSEFGATQISLFQQGKHLSKVMPTLKRYIATPKSYYLTSDMYHESLENRAAMLADFTDILIQYQKQLVSAP